MTAAEQQVVDRITTSPATFDELKAAHPDLAEKMFAIADGLIGRGVIVRVKRVQAGAVFALPGVTVANRKPDPPAPRPTRERAPELAPVLTPKRRAGGPVKKKPRKVPHVIWNTPGSAPPALDAKEETVAKISDSIDSATAAEIIGISKNMLTTKYKREIKHEGGGYGYPLQFSRAAVEKFAAEYKSDDDAATSKRKSVKPPPEAVERPCGRRSPARGPLARRRLPARSADSGGRARSDRQRGGC